MKSTRWGKFWKVVLIAMVVLVGMYAWIVPKPPDFRFQFLERLKLNHYGIARGGDLAPPAFEFADYDADMTYSELTRQIRNELPNWRETDLTGTYIHKSCSFLDDKGTEILIAESSSPKNSTVTALEIGILRPVEPTWLVGLRLTLFPHGIHH